MRISRRQFGVSILGSLPWPGGAQENGEEQMLRVAVGFRFTEGPVWSREGFLLFSDVPNNRIMKYVPGEKPVMFRENANGANGNVFDAQGRLYTCESHTRRVVRMEKKGEMQILADKDGHVYFTDPAFGNQADARELDFYGVYHITPKGELRLVAKPVGRPNGIAFSHNGRVLYVANSDEHLVRAYDVDRNGEVSNERVVISGVDGVPDGIRVDEKGNIYVAANGVAIYDAQGKFIETLGIAETPANCAFGDADLQTLYITARTALYRIRRDVKGALQY
jgi:gluconolactonase